MSTLTRVTFHNGEQRIVNSLTLDVLVGIDGEGNLVAQFDNFQYPLTPCCNASGKGSGGGVVCRSCYQYVSSYFGGEATAVSSIVKVEN